MHVQGTKAPSDLHTEGNAHHGDDGVRNDDRKRHTLAHADLAIGETLQFTATGTYTDASTVDLTSLATWQSGDPADLTVSASGLATGIGGPSAFAAGGFPRGRTIEPRRLRSVPSGDTMS